jgi:pyridoxal biosynthesis lyase PdxS
VQEVPQSWVEKLQERLGNTALAKRIAALRETEAMRSVVDGYASVKEKLESGDSEVVNRVSEMRERLMAETETARALREIRMRHPSFDMPSFLRAIKKDVPVVIKVRVLAAPVLNLIGLQSACMRLARTGP